MRGSFKNDIFHHGDVETWRKRRKAQFLGKRSCHKCDKCCLSGRTQRTQRRASLRGRRSIPTLPSFRKLRRSRDCPESSLCILYKGGVFHHPFVTCFIDVTHWRHRGHGERLRAGLRRSYHNGDVFYHRATEVTEETLEFRTFSSSLFLNSESSMDFR